MDIFSDDDFIIPHFHSIYRVDRALLYNYIQYILQVSREIHREINGICWHNDAVMYFRINNNDSIINYYNYNNHDELIDSQSLAEISIDETAYLCLYFHQEFGRCPYLEGVEQIDFVPDIFWL
jgi:hypothetical protein